MGHRCLELGGIPEIKMWLYILTFALGFIAGALFMLPGINKLHKQVIDLARAMVAVRSEENKRLGELQETVRQIGLITGLFMPRSKMH